MLDLTAKRVLRIVLPVSLLLGACVGGQSGAEGNMNPKPGGPGGACTAVPGSFDFDHAKSLAGLRGRHETSLAWLPIDPFGSIDASSTVRAVLDVDPQGDFVNGNECGDPQMEIAATLELPDQRRKSEFKGRALFRNDRTILMTDSTSSFAHDLAVPGAALRGEDHKRYRLLATIVDAAFSGTLTGADEPGCQSGRMPADSHGCSGGSREVDWETQYGAFALGGAVDDLQQLGAQRLALRDGTSTDVELSVSRADGSVCAEGFWMISTDAVHLTAPVTVHVRSVERGIDFDMKAEISAVASSFGLAVMFDTAFADGVSVNGTAVAPSTVFGSQSGAPFLRLDVTVKARPDGTSGELSVVEADRASGWPEIELSDDATLVTATQLECVGLAEGGSIFEGYFGSPEDTE